MRDKANSSYETKLANFRSAMHEMVYVGGYGMHDMMTYPLPTMKVVDYIEHKTDHGTFWLKKHLFIMPIEDSGLMIKIRFFAAYDKQEHTIYYTVSRRDKDNDDNPPS